MNRDEEERKVKREMMATAAMMGLLAGRDPHGHLSTEGYARVAVEQADALLKELEKGDGER